MHAEMDVGTRSWESGPLDCTGTIEDSNDVPERPTPEGEAAVKLAEAIVATLKKNRHFVGVRCV